MRLTSKEAVNYIAEQGYTIKETAYRQQLKRLRAKSSLRLRELALNFSSIHLQHLDTFHSLEKEAWILFRTAKSEKAKVDLLRLIADLQKDQALFEGETQIVIEDQIRKESMLKHGDIPPPIRTLETDKDDKRYEVNPI